MPLSANIIISAPSGSGPFDIYSDADGYAVPFLTNVALGSLLSPGLYVTNIPDWTTNIKVVPTGDCAAPAFIPVICALPTTTTTTSTTSTTTSTTSTTSTTTTTTSAPPTTTTTTTSTSTTTSTTSTSTSTTSTTTTTTLDPCYVLMNSGANVYNYNVNTNTATLLIVPNAVASPDIAHTNNKMWLTNLNVGAFVEWNITFYPWSASYVGNRIWPAGFSSSKGLWAINDTTLLAVNEFVVGVSTVVEIDVITNTVTNKFNLDTNDVVSGDFMLTCNGKFIVSTFDSVTGDVFVTQYDYATGAIEVQLNVTGVLAFPFGIFQHNGKIYLGNHNSGGSIYWLQNWPPYTIVTPPVGSLGAPVDGASQIPGDCSCTFLGSTTTTTSTTSTTTTSTTTSTTSTTSTTTTTTRPPAICHTVGSSGGDAWVQYYNEFGILQWNQYIPTNATLVYCIEDGSLFQTGGSGLITYTLGPVCNGVPCPTTTTTSTTSTTTTSTTSTTTTSTTTSTTSTTSTTTTTTKFVPTTTTTSTTTSTTSTSTTSSTTTSTTSTTSTTTTTTATPPCFCIDLKSSGPISSYTTFFYDKCGVGSTVVNVSNSTVRVCYTSGTSISYANYNGAVQSTINIGSLCTALVGCPTTTTSTTSTTTTTSTTSSTTSTTSTTTTTTLPCKCFKINLVNSTPQDLEYVDCITYENAFTTIQPGYNQLCAITVQDPLPKGGEIISNNILCADRVNCPSTTTTTTSSTTTSTTSTTSTTTTTTVPCECITFVCPKGFFGTATWTNCGGVVQNFAMGEPESVLRVCGSNPSVSNNDLYYVNNGPCTLIP